MLSIRLLNVYLQKIAQLPFSYLSPYRHFGYVVIFFLRRTSLLHIIGFSIYYYSIWAAVAQNNVLVDMQRPGLLRFHCRMLRRLLPEIHIISRLPIEPKGQ